MYYYEDCIPGTAFPLAPVTIDSERLRAFAEAYDPLPIHLDAAYAEKTRFAGIIAPGVMSFMAVWAEFVKMNVFGDALVAGKSTHIEWLAPVYPGDVLTGTVTFTGRHSTNPHTGVVEQQVEIRNQQGVMAIRDVTETVVRKRENAAPPTGEENGENN